MIVHPKLQIELTCTAGGVFLTSSTSWVEGATVERISEIAEGIAETLRELLESEVWV